MSSLVVAVALCDANIQTEKHMEILQKNPYLFNLPSVNTSVPIVEECDLNMNQPSTGTPEQDEFDMINANTPKKFAVMVKRTNQNVKHTTNTSTPRLSTIKEENKKIKHEGRDLLDLRSNLLSSINFYQPAVLPTDSHGFFQNRSQIHRVNSSEETTTKYVKVCNHCDFEVPIFD